MCDASLAFMPRVYILVQSFAKDRCNTVAVVSQQHGKRLSQLHRCLAMVCFEAFV